jgi:uncharacterized protein (TIGR02391 family)
MDFVDTERYENEVEYANDWADRNTWVLEVIFGALADSERWPKLGPLQRQALRSGEQRDVLDAARQLPRSLGSVGYDESGNGDVARLTVRGLSYCDQATDLLSDFVRCVKVAYRTYVEADDAPRISKADVAREVGAEGRALDQLSDVFLSESWFLSSGNGSAGDDWVRDLHDSVRYLNSVETVDDYLQTQAEILYLRPYSAAALAQRAIERLTAEPVPASADLSTIGAAAPRRESSLDWLDPAIAEAAQKLFDDAHFMEAVTQASLALARQVRVFAGLEPESVLDGVDLMGHAFGGTDPPIRIPAEDPQTQGNLQEGTRLMAQGVMRGIRNPLAHRRIELSMDEAMEMLAAMSLVARRARRAKDATSEDKPT